jgi:hypothetical protein
MISLLAIPNYLKVDSLRFLAGDLIFVCHKSKKLVPKEVIQVFVNLLYAFSLVVQFALFGSD